MSYPCPCCKNLTLSEPPPGTYELCAVCYWEDDAVQFHNPQYEGGANTMSLVVAQEAYLRFGAISEELIPFVRKPSSSELPERSGGRDDRSLHDGGPVCDETARTDKRS